MTKEKSQFNNLEGEELLLSIPFRFPEQQPKKRLAIFLSFANATVTGSALSSYSISIL